jgi:hypothetical protein
MSRSFRVSVKESVSKVVKAEDSVSTQLEVLGVLPPEDMAGLLEQELAQHGFDKVGEKMVRTEKGITVSVDAKTCTVTVSVEASEQAAAEGEKEGRAYDDVGPSAGAVREQLRKELQKDLEKKIQEKQAALQGKVTDKLEAALSDLRDELDQAVNHVTAEALKVKAAQLGQIKEITEDPETGSMTIVVAV